MSWKARGPRFPDKERRSRSPGAQWVGGHGLEPDALGRTLRAWVCSPGHSGCSPYPGQLCRGDRYTDLCATSPTAQVRSGPQVLALDLRRGSCSKTEGARAAPPPQGEQHWNKEGPSGYPVQATACAGGWSPNTSQSSKPLLICCLHKTQ